MAKLLGTEVNGNKIDRYWLHAGDDGNDRITVETVEDIEPVIEANKVEYNENRKHDGLKKVASIPGTIIMELCRINKISFRELMLGKSERSQQVMNGFLNDPAFRHFRTAPGRVDVKNDRAGHQYRPEGGGGRSHRCRRREIHRLGQRVRPGRDGNRSGVAAAGKPHGGNADYVNDEHHGRYVAGDRLDNCHRATVSDRGGGVH